MSEEQRPHWEHQAGDRYVILAGSIVGNEVYGFETWWEPYYPAQGSVDAAIVKGLATFDHDDFGIGVLRQTRDGQKLVARLWMHEIVDDDPLVVAEIAEKAGL